MGVITYMALGVMVLMLQAAFPHPSPLPRCRRGNFCCYNKAERETRCYLDYQPCRWYDRYPRLADTLQLIRLLPLEKQRIIGERLHAHLTHRLVSSIQNPADLPVLGHRWYDEVDPLLISLDLLQSAPEAVKYQSIDFLIQLLDHTVAHKT